MKDKIKVLIIVQKLQHYRIPIYNILGNHYDLTVAVNNIEVKEKISFKLIYSNTVRNGPFLIQYPSVYKLVRGFDVVIALFNIRCLDLVSLSFMPHKFKLIYWGIGVSASYSKGYDVDKKLDFLRRMMIKKSDAMIFYTNYPVNKYKDLDVEKMFVANNTLKTSDLPIDLNKSREYILFVGSLYREKGIEYLLNAYMLAKKKIGNNIKKLVIIGEGDEREYIERFIAENQLVNNVELAGGIFDQDRLKTYYEKSLISVSPNQAGLSILNSFGYGVPFVTNNNAITGGEIFNITTGVNGLLFETFEEFVEILIDTSYHPDKYVKMGERAFKYYKSNREPEQMAEGMLKAIEYVTQNR